MTCASCVGRVERALLKVPAAQRGRESGQRARPRRSTRPAGPGRADPGRRGSRLSRHGEQRAPPGGRCRTTPAARTLGSDRRFVAGRTAGAADVRRTVRAALDAAGMDPVPARHPSAVHPRRTLLRRRLEGGACWRRQHGPAGRHRHQRRLWPEPLSMVGDAGRADAAPVFRGLGGGDRPGAAGQIPGKPRQAPDQRGNPGAGSLAPGPRDTGDRRPRGGGRHRRAAPGRPSAGQAWRAFPGGRRSGRGREPGRRSTDQRRACR